MLAETRFFVRKYMGILLYQNNPDSRTNALPEPPWQKKSIKLHPLWDSLITLFTPWKKILKPKYFCYFYLNQVRDIPHGCLTGNLIICI